MSEKLANPLTPYLGALAVFAVCVYFYERSKTRKEALVDETTYTQQEVSVNTSAFTSSLRERSTKPSLPCGLDPGILPG